MMHPDQGSGPQYFSEKKPGAIRLWHWLTFLFFSVSVTTVVFASTIFRTRNNIEMVKEQVAQKGGSLTRDQAFSVAHEYSDKLWGLHKWLGYGLSILLLWRVVIEMMLSKSDRLGTRIRKALSFPDLGGEKKHHLWVHYGYAVFYVLFFTMAITGLVLAFEDVSWLDPVHKAANSIHSVVQYGLYAYVILHLAGVIRADLTRYGGIVSRMINGRTKEHRS